MKLWSCVMLLMVVKESVAMPPVNHCLSKFEDSLKQTVALKKSCDEASLKDCCQIAEASKIIDNENYTPGSGIYDISNLCQSKAAFTRDICPPMQARCDMESNGGGWTVLVRRTPDVDQRELFDRTWEEYENGFGNLTGEFWYGLKNMHCLTSREQMEVEVEMRKIDGTKLVLAYGSFRIDGPGTSYALRVSDQKHEGFDHFGYHNGRIFSTRDRVASGTRCSGITTGWWFSTCYRLHLTHTTQPRLANPSISNYDYAELRVRSKSCISELTSEPSSCQ